MKILRLLIGSALSCVPHIVNASTILLPGQTVDPLTDSADPGLIFVTGSAVSFNTGYATGELATLVETSSSNPYGASDTVFGYEVIVSTGTVVSVSGSGFSAFNVAVQDADDGGTLIPALSATRSSNGDDITFNFSGINGSSCTPPGPCYGSQSAALLVYSSASGYTDPLATITDSTGHTAEVETLGPAVAPVPLPAAAWLMLSGLGGLGAWSRKKRTA